MWERAGDDGAGKRCGINATKDMIDHSEIISFVALRWLRKSRKSQEVDTESVCCLALRMGNEVALAVCKSEAMRRVRVIERTYDKHCR
jgi:hypothetical protein